MDKIKKEWIDWMNAKILQKAVVVDNEGNILVLKRSETKPIINRQGKWDFVGGSISLDDLASNGQLHEQALAREAQEEACLEINEIVPICVRSGKKLTQTAGEVLVYAVGFKCKVKGIKPPVILSDEHTEYKWVSPDELTNVDFGEDEEGFHRQTIKAFLKK